MASPQDDVLSVSEHSSGEFSGFSASEVADSGRKKKKMNKKASSKPSKQKSTASTSKKDDSNAVRGNTEKHMNFDIMSLGASDIAKLRDLLGIQNPNVVTQQNVDSADDEDLHSIHGYQFDRLPPVHVEFDPNDLSGGESPSRLKKDKNISVDLSSALFSNDKENEEGDDGWELPKLKVPEKGKPIAKTLAKLINTACTTQCETDNLLGKYKVPQNCDMACPPTVNSEIWKIMERRAQTQDRGIAETQNLLAASMVPIIQLAETFQSQFASNSVAKTMLSDALTLIGQAQFNLSIRRRYMIRPVLKKKYHSLCNIGMPITTQLFGDDVSKDIKSCDSLISLGKEQYQSSKPFYPTRGRGRGQSQSQYGYQSNSGNRYQPYQRGQRRPWGNNYRIPKKGSASATVTAPNDQK